MRVDCRHQSEESRANQRTRTIKVVVHKFITGTWSKVEKKKHGFT